MLSRPAGRRNRRRRNSVVFADKQLAAIEPSLEPSDLFVLTTGVAGTAATSGASRDNLPNLPPTETIPTCR